MGRRRRRGREDYEYDSEFEILDKILKIIIQRICLIDGNDNDDFEDLDNTHIMVVMKEIILKQVQDMANKL